MDAVRRELRECEHEMRSLDRPLRCLVFTAGLSIWAGAVHALCTGPDGQAGDLRYATNYNTVAFCDGTNWMSLAGWIAGAGGATVLDGLTDVNTAGASPGQVLMFDGATWIPSTTTSGEGLLGDRIVSGTTNVVAHNNASVTFAIGGVERMTLGSNGNLGIGANNPVAKLDVSGTARVQGSLQITQGPGNEPCGPGHYGTIRHGSDGDLEVCLSDGL